MNTLLLVGGDLCLRTLNQLDALQWRGVGLRRRPMPDDDGHRVRWVQADLGDPARLPAALAALPAITHILYAPAPDQRTPECYRRVYPDGLQALLRALPHPTRLQRCVLVDSTAVWGPSDDWVDETTPTVPEDFRGACMLEAEAALHAAMGTGFPHASATALRLSGLYGPGRTRLIAGLQAARIPAPDGPGHWSNRIHIDDAARACAHLLTLRQPLPCYIGTDDHPMPTTELYDALAVLADASRPPRVPRPPDGKRLSNAKLRASGWAPQWPDMIEGYQALIEPVQSSPQRG